MEMYELTFGLGALLLLVGLVGGGLEIKEFRIPKLTTSSRAAAAALGLIFILLGFWAWKADPSGMTEGQEDLSRGARPGPESTTVPVLVDELPTPKKVVEALLVQDFEGDRYELGNWNLGEKQGGRRGKSGSQRIFVDHSTGSRESERSLAMDFRLGTERVPTHLNAPVRARIMDSEVRDLRAYEGVRFDARANQDMEVRLVVADREVDHSENEYWVRDISVGLEWKESVISFASLALAGGQAKAKGTNQQLDLERIEWLAWVVSEKSFPRGEAGTIWIDNVALYKTR
jgi:hypothetical protein